MAGVSAPRFVCDAMLGGLARCLRAAGYDASWHDGIDDGALLGLAQDEGRTVLSSDGDVFAFALVRDGAVPALFVPRDLTVQGQLTHVLRALALPLAEPRCMACGGELTNLPRERAAGRVPPRSLAGHDHVFWSGRSAGEAHALPRTVEVVDRDMAAILRGKSEAERLAIAWGMWRSARSMLANLLRTDHSDWTDAQVNREIARRFARGSS